MFRANDTASLPTVPINRIDPERYPPGHVGTHAAMLAVAHEALVRAGRDPAQPLHDCALIVGTSGFSYIAEAEFRRAAATGQTLSRLPIATPGVVIRQLAIALGIAGPVFCLSNACASSANALLVARDLILRRQVSCALVLGAENLSAIALSGFQSLLLLDTKGCRPFDATRRGLQLGEGMAALLLEPAGGDGGYSKQIRLCGGTNLCDPHHVTATNPNGDTMAHVMRAARAQAHGADIVAIKAHGAGSVDNDLAEANALRAVFGTRLPPITALKRCLGHTLAACGAVETVAFLACLDAGFIPATGGFEQVDPALAISPITQAQPAQTGVYLLNFFGFGGNFASLVIAHG